MGPLPAVAVIGMAGRFPGAPDIQSFWTLLRSGSEAITFFSDAELLAAGESPDRLTDPAYVRACGKLAGIDQFDAAFFGMSPRDAAVFDPQHRLFLETAWETFENAGYVGEKFDGRVGVFGACGAAEYMMYNLVRNRHTMETVGPWLVRHNGNDPNFLATRVSYELNLSGPSMNVQSACSSSLVAVHLACQSLLSGESDMVLAGGATVYPDQNRGYLYKEGEILSPDGHCRPFDARAAGTVMSSAVGCVLLKRLDDAMRDGDQVLAIVRGSAINNDGSEKVGYLAPSVSGQARVIGEALAVSGVAAQDITYVEAHGTGTLIGDPIEVTALTEAFRAVTAAKRFCALGSLKSNIGHTGEAAGICGFIKVVLSLVHREIPPSLHFEQPNPQIDFANSPFFVNTRLRPWAVPAGTPRVAAVTALGAGGTNAHVLVQEGPSRLLSDRGRTHQLVVLSARTPGALDRASTNLATHLRANAETSLSDVAYTLLGGRTAFAHRRALVATSALDAADALESRDPKRVITHHAKEDVPSVVFMFPGGGTQYARMGAGLYASETVYREAFDACLRELEAPLRSELTALCFAPSERAAEAGVTLEAPSRGLPALFATEYAVARLLMSWGISPSAMIGHSAGEYTAACLAGVLGLRDAVALVAVRGRLFETLPDGGMLSVPLPEHEAAKWMGPELSFAAVNAPALSVVSGPVSAIAKMEGALREHEIESSRVRINVAAHSKMLEPILAEFESFCRGIRFKLPKTRFVSNLTGTWITDAEATSPAYWVRHLRGTVRFCDGLQTILGGETRALLEVGPGRTLSSFARQQKTKAAVIAQTLRHPIEDTPDVDVLLGAVGRLWTAGVPIDEARFGDGPRPRVSLPTYPFERQRYWVNPDAQDSPPSGAKVRKRPDVGDWFYAPSWARSAPAKRSSRALRRTWLVFTDGSSLASKLVGRLRDSGDRVVEVAAGTGFTKRSPDSFTIVAGERLDYDRLAAELREGESLPQRVLHLWGLRRRPRRTALHLSPWDPVEGHANTAALYHYSLIFFVQAFADEGEGLTIVAVSSHMQAVSGDVDIHPEKALLLGATKVIPREYAATVCASIDVAHPRDRHEEDDLAVRLVREVDADDFDANEIAIRGRNRWVRSLDRIRLEPRARDWLRDQGVYLVTGGLGGIGLAVAEHLAAHAKARLVLVGRTPLPSEDAGEEWIASHGSNDETSRRILRVRAIRALGGEVLTLAADVTDFEAMREVLRAATARFGAVHGVFHAAGVLDDELIALRPAIAASEVIDVKAKGALVLDRVLSHQPLDLFVLFSSVSSILGLPGQSNYTAANAFLDAFAHARTASHPDQRTVSIDWNAWQDIGMLARLIGRDKDVTSREDSPSSTRLLAGHPLLAEVTADKDGITSFRTSVRRAESWVLSEHVVRGGDAVMPGTGFLEIARAALEYHHEDRAVELRDILFIAPFVVKPGDEPTFHVRIKRDREGAFVIHARAENDVLVSGKASYIDAPPSARVEFGPIRDRCNVPVPSRGGFLEQHFMNFGPRWGNVKSLDRGTGEAFLHVALPEEFADDLDAYHLHPALLDVATGGAQVLVPGFDARSTFYVPFSYGRVVLHRALTQSLYSHVRLRDASARDAAIFDIDLYDEAGDVLASIEGFVMCRVKGAFAAAGRESALRSPAGSPVMRPPSAEEVALRQGMTPMEGLDALDRVLGNPVSPCVVACSVDLPAWLEQLARDARPGQAGSNGQESQGPVFARPNLSTTYAAPRDDIERELAAMWRELLGAQEVGVNDDFFELGGQSLVAVRLFHRIGRKFGVELSMATLFQAPTIAQCASILRARAGIAEPSGTGEELQSEPKTAGPPESVRSPSAFRSLVALQGGSGNLLPFFCVHGAGGNVLKFRDLSRAMSRAQTFYGLQAYGVDGVNRPHETIEEMAAAYLAEIREVQPRGPYILGGYSGGGVVAFEIAQRLGGLGEEVRLLALIDTPHPQMPVRRVNHLTVLLGDGIRTRVNRLVSGGIPYVVEGLRQQRERRRVLARQTLNERTIAELRGRGESIPFALREIELVRNFERAVARYVPRPWDGHAVLFRAAEVDFLFADGGTRYGWEKNIRGGVEVVQVPGGHHTLVVGANAEILARSLSEAIERVQVEVFTQPASVRVREASA